jgi:hypothetical protein
MRYSLTVLSRRGIRDPWRWDQRHVGECEPTAFRAIHDEDQVDVVNGPVA